MSTMYEKLVAAGVPPEFATAAIIRHVAFTGSDAEVTVSVVRNLKTPVPIFGTAEQPKQTEKTPLTRKLRQTAQSRVLGYVLLNRAYRTKTRIRVPVTTLFSYMKKAFEAYGVEVNLPTGSSLQQALSHLRNGKVRGLPAIETQGPVVRQTNGVPDLFVFLEPRDEIKDFLSDLQLPPWVWNEMAPEKEEVK